MGRKTTEVSPGDIFMIPLFLPSHQMDEYTLDYRKYRFHADDIYAFGRLIEIQAGNVDLIEVFSYTGQIPQDPGDIIRSGRMFAPEHIGHPFSRKGRWQVIFSDPQYDVWKDSDYENISFLYPKFELRMLKGKEEIRITKEKWIESKDAGIPEWIFHSRIDLEIRIRSVLKARGIELNYAQTVDERQSEYPKPRDPDKKLKEMIAPFRWTSGNGRYTLTLDAGLLNHDQFTRNNRSGNGYDWGEVASAFMKKQGTDPDKKFSFDCETDTFSVTSSSKKMLKEFSISFHEFVMDTSAFEEFLSQLS